METAHQKKFSSLNEALASLYGNGVRVTQRTQVFGGDINESYELTLAGGEDKLQHHADHEKHIFMKTNAISNLSFFEAEAAGLDALRKTKAVGVPEVLGCGIEAGGIKADGIKADSIKAGSRGYAFLLMEYLDEGKRRTDYWETFAKQLACMHQAPTEGLVPRGVFGFWQDNYIGSRRQANTAHESWIDFFRECRLRPQFESAAHYFGRSEIQRIDKLLGQAERILVEPEQPSLLHGDLWSGNVITGYDGRAWLIDPAAYVGHAEADLAMTELFGGFPSAFYEAYKKAAPLQPGYSHRRDFYNLYHLLNHLNMFGRTYLSSVMRIVDEYIL